MSIYIGRGNSGKPQVHLTKVNYNESTMKGGPVQETTFHSDLPYITVLDTIRQSEGSARRSQMQSYMNQGYLFKKVYRAYVRGGNSTFPGATASFRTSVDNLHYSDRAERFQALAEINPSRGWDAGAVDTWGPGNYTFQNFEGNRVHFLVAVDTETYEYRYTVGAGGDYYNNEPGSNQEVHLRSGAPNRHAKGSATLRGQHKDYTLLNSQVTNYNPWGGDYTNRTDLSFIVFNARRTTGSGYQYINDNNDPGSQGIYMDKNDITVGANYSMRNTGMLADLGGSGGLVYYNSSVNEYFLSVPRLLSTETWRAGNPIWDFFNSTYKVGTQYTREMDEVAQVFEYFWLWVNDANTIIGWDVRPAEEDSMVNINPNKLLGSGAGLEITDDVIRFDGSNGKSITVASPSTDFLSLPADPVTVVAPALSNVTFESIRAGMYSVGDTQPPYEGGQNLGDPWTTWERVEDVGYAPFPPSVKANHDSVRMILDHEWGGGVLGINKGGYYSYNYLDHETAHAPMTILRSFKTPSGLSQIGGEFYHHTMKSTEVNFYCVGATCQPTNDATNKTQAVSCSYRLYADWPNNRFVIRRVWRAQSGNFHWQFFSYNQWIPSRVTAYNPGEILYHIPEVKISIYVLSSVANNYTY